MAAIPAIGCALAGAAKPSTKAVRARAFLKGTLTFRADHNGP
jgi:hypothetical protein